MDVRDYLRILRQRWLSILFCALVAAAIAGGLTALQTPTYASNARLFVSTSQTDDSQLLQGGQYSAQRVKSYADLVTSRELLSVLGEVEYSVPPLASSEAVSLF